MIGTARRRAGQARLVAADRLLRWTEPVRAAAGPVLAPVAGPVRRVVSPAAWAVLAVAVPAGWAGYAWAWTELRVLAWALVFLLVVAVAFVLGRHQLASSLDLSRDRVVVGERATGRLLVANRTRRRTLPLTVELPVGAARADFDLPSLGAQAEHEELFVIPTSRRAVLTLGPVRSVRADPLHLLRRKQDLAPAQLLHVHPRTVPVLGSTAGIVHDLEGESTRTLTDSDVSFHALRAYVPGDDRRYVHWKTTARTGTMMVRQFEETRRSHLLIALSTRLDDYASAEEFELAVSIAGSLGVQTMRDGHGLSVATSTRDLSAPTSRGLLDALAGVDFESRAPRLSAVTRDLALSVAQATVVVVVCGSLAPAAETRSAARRFSIDVRTLVMRADPATEQSLRRVADVDVATVAHLDELPALSRRLAR